jgi:hypothetical protein
VNRFSTALLYGCTARLTTQNGGSRPPRAVAVFNMHTFLGDTISRKVGRRDMAIDPRSVLVSGVSLPSMQR